MDATPTHSLIVLACVLALNRTNARSLSRTGPSTNVSTAPRASLRCLTCHGERFPGCYDPIVQSVPVRDCEGSVTACYTRFGVDGEVERGCFNKQTLPVMTTCATPFCNNVQGPHLPLYYSNQYEWREHLKTMEQFMNTNKQPLWCVSCVTTETEAPRLRVRLRGGGGDGSLPRVSPSNDCFHLPRNKVANNSKLCNPDEVCKIELEEGRYLRRSCTKVADDHVVLACETDYCNSDILTLSSTPFIRVGFSGGSAAGCSEWLLLVATIRFACEVE